MGEVDDVELVDARGVRIVGLAWAHRATRTPCIFTYICSRYSYVSRREQGGDMTNRRVESSLKSHVWSLKAAQHGIIRRIEEL